MKSVTTLLMFQGQANEAIEQYQQWFTDLEVASLSYTEDSQQVAMAVLHLKGLKLMVNVLSSTISYLPDQRLSL